jgi:hypothetical protein
MTDSWTVGGFNTKWIKGWLLDECLSTDDPHNFLLAIMDIVEHIQDNIDHYSDDSWEEIVEYLSK